MYLCSYVDYMLLMAYNYHGSWNNRTGHHSGLYPRLDEQGAEREFNQVSVYICVISCCDVVPFLEHILFLF